MSAYKPHLQRTCLHNYGNSTIPENMQPVLIGSQFFMSISYYMLADTSHRRHFLLLRTSRHQLEDIKYKKTLPPPFASFKKASIPTLNSRETPPIPQTTAPGDLLPKHPLWRDHLLCPVILSMTADIKTTVCICLSALTGCHTTRSMSCIAWQRATCAVSWTLVSSRCKS